MMNNEKINKIKSLDKYFPKGDKRRGEALVLVAEVFLLGKESVHENEETIIERAKKYNGLITTIDDLFNHMDRLEKCSICRRDYWDKRCPDCLKLTHKTVHNLTEKGKLEVKNV